MTVLGKRLHPVLRAVLGIAAVVAGAAVVVSLVGAGLVTSLARTYDRTTTTIHTAFPDAPRPVADERGALDVLLIGSDARSPSAGNGRSDSLMLLHIGADRRAVFVMSIMRDSWVDVPGHGMAKINAAYSWGGVPLTVQTVEQLLGVRVDHVAEIGFEGFAAMTDALGGVDVDAPKAFTWGGHAFASGRNHLDGAEALSFVRARYPFADADHQRVANQQSFMRGVARAVLSRGTLTNPARIGDLVTATASHLSVDPGLTSRRLVDIGWSLRDLRADDVHTFTLASSGGGTAADGQSYVSIDAASLASLRSALTDDDLGRYLDTRPR
ncbi:LCP family protein [Curtobacterium sp. RRHDQ10]|uniref:LCP family protein n=1 Tax=Curtobacterium phyllosphaerae TaxID=3413379 RepID=UPI003BF09654